MLYLYTLMQWRIRGTGFEKMTAEYKDADLTHKPYIYMQKMFIFLLYYLIY